VATSGIDENSYHETRFAFDERREVLWRALCDYYFNRLIQPDDHVLELGAGYGHFINNIRCARKSAIDQWPGLLRYAKPPVNAAVGSVTELDFVPDSSVDFVFASNLFEHLTQADFSATLEQVKRKLKPNGTLNILQPNYRLAYREYFDDYTHVSVYSDTSLCDFVQANGFKVIESIPGFLPFSIKSSTAPVRPWLIHLYLSLPWKPLAKQMLIRAKLAR
jgi:ubiquinone/menaquinone biosynthesis C-methylase UbiE